MVDILRNDISYIVLFQFDNNIILPESIIERWNHLLKKVDETNIPYLESWKSVYCLSENILPHDILDMITDDRIRDHKIGIFKYGMNTEKKYNRFYTIVSIFELVRNLFSNMENDVLEERNIFIRVYIRILKNLHIKLFILLSMAYIETDILENSNSDAIQHLQVSIPQLVCDLFDDVSDYNVIDFIREFNNHVMEITFIHCSKGDIDEYFYIMKLYSNLYKIDIGSLFSYQHKIKLLNSSIQKFYCCKR